MLHFRALILYAYYCTRQTARDTTVLGAVEQMIRKEKGIGKQGLKTGLRLEIIVLALDEDYFWNYERML